LALIVLPLSPGFHVVITSIMTRCERITTHAW